MLKFFLLLVSMFTTTFNVGPSQICPETYNDLRSAIDLRVAEYSHRSADFSAISQKAIEGMRMFFGIPDDYYIFYTASATDAMQQTIGSMVAKSSFHISAGNWGEVFGKVSKKYGKNISSDKKEWGAVNNFDSINVPGDAELITICMNDTSTGVQVSNQELAGLRKNNPNTLIAADVVSLAGARAINISDADVWLFSVQKCLGLPAGLGALVVSPRAYERSQELIDESKNLCGYTNWSAQQKKMDGVYQTVCTPNALGIYLLAEKLERWNTDGGIQTLEQQTAIKADMLYGAVHQFEGLTNFIENEAARSHTVVCLQGSEEAIIAAHTKAKEKGILLGKGYGALKKTTLRIGNFPAITKENVEELIAVLSA